MIKLIATDLDNTLLDKSSRIPDDTLAVIHEVVNSGVLVAVATGRSFHSANHVADLISPDAPVICYNGSLIKDASDNILYEAYVDFDLVREIVSWAHEKDVYVQLYDDDVIVVETLRTDRHPDPDLKFTEYREVGDLLAVEPFRTPKMLLAAPPERIPGLQAELEERYRGFLFFAQSDSHLIEVMPSGVDKGAALRRLAEIEGVDISETMALGDNTNYILLLKASGFAVAVNNAVPQLKAIADYVCDGERSEGVSEAMKKFVLCDDPE